VTRPDPAAQALAWCCALHRAHRAWARAEAGEDEREEAVMHALQALYLDAQTEAEERAGWARETQRRAK